MQREVLLAVGANLDDRGASGRLECAAQGLDAVGVLVPAAVQRRHLVLPAITLSVVYMALIARMTRASMLGVLGEDYIRTAFAKGLAPRRVARRSESTSRTTTATGRSHQASTSSCASSHVSAIERREKR